VVEGERGRAQIKVNIDGEEKRVNPEAVSAEVLKKMKKIAENRWGSTVTKAVVTIPAYFNDCQRQATLDACLLAGLDCARIINEPTAAAIAYGLDQMSDERKNILVFDMGGGTLDISIIEVEGGDLQVLATRGDAYLGGRDIDELLVNHCLEEYNRNGIEKTSVKQKELLRKKCQ
jgi:L1 cell adhesion molecule like protein